MNWFFAVLKKYADFTGRAGRPEFWYYTLIVFGINVLFYILMMIPFLGVLFLIAHWAVSLGLLLPSLAVGARRLHDTGRTGWWQLLYIVPVIGFIVLIIFFATEGDRAPNEYGPSPDDQVAIPA